MWRPSGGHFINLGFEEIIIPSIWTSKTFIEKAGGSEILEQMFSFDKSGTEMCLIPEVTGIIQELFEIIFSRKVLLQFIREKCFMFHVVIVMKCLHN